MELRHRRFQPRLNNRIFFCFETIFRVNLSFASCDSARVDASKAQTHGRVLCSNNLRAKRNYLETSL
jgi:hypothetical protein